MNKTQQKINGTLLGLIVSLCVSAFSHQSGALAIPFSGEYDNREGHLSPGHDQALNTIREKYFYSSTGALDISKVKSLRDFLVEQRRLLEHSAKLNRKTNLILVHGLGNEKGEKEGLQALDEEAETLAPVNFAIEGIDALISSYSQLSKVEIEQRVETILLWYGSVYTIYPVGIFTSAVERIKNLRENFFDYPIDDSKATQASNLLLPSQKPSGTAPVAEQRFATDADLRNLRSKGFDISQLDPPSSAFWSNNPVEEYDAEAETYFDRKLFPPRSVDLPEVEYERMGNGQVKFKTKWIDRTDLTKKGKPKEKSLTLRVGWEAYTATVVNHLARALGYPAIPTTFRRRVKMNLGETTFEEFMSQYKSVHWDPC